jgi:uridine kinase
MMRRRLLDGLAAQVADLASANDHGPFLVAVDGVDGVGKTTFADELAATLEAAGVGTFRASVDGFHHPPDVRYRRGRTSPEGFYLDSYDLSALHRRLVDPLRPGGDRRVVRAVYDVVREEPVTLPVEVVDERAVVILDGLFLHRPELADRWDLSIFLAAPVAVTVARCAARDGTDPDPASPANRRYVEGQQHYLDACQPQMRATIVVDHTALASPRIVVDRLAGC